MMRSHILIALAAIVALAGCATAGDGPRVNPNRITAEELDAREFNTAFDAVQTMRPQWFRGDRAGTNVPVTVYLDGSRMGGPDALRQIRAEGVVSMQFLSASEASTRFGMGHAGGAILVSTGRR
jgi:hypothetical protein